MPSEDDGLDVAPAASSDGEGVSGEPEENLDRATHVDDGLDLARSLTQATAGTTPVASRRRRREGDPSPGGPGRARGGRPSGAHPDDRDPQLLEGIVSRLVGDRGWELSLRMRGVFARWPELVGEEIADHCSPESFNDGTLVVRTESTAWATQLKLLAPRLVGRLNDDLGPGTVTLIEVLGPHLPSWKKGPRSVRDGRGPRDTYG